MEAWIEYIMHWYIEHSSYLAFRFVMAYTTAIFPIVEFEMTIEKDFQCSTQHLLLQ
jgi:hypothetical protein